MELICFQTCLNEDLPTGKCHSKGEIFSYYKRVFIEITVL
jgi:hypothetical protein